MPRNTAPMKVILPSTLVMKSLVGLPGRIAGDGAVVVAQIVGDLHRVILHRHIEIVERNDEQQIDRRIHPAGGS